MSMMKSVCAGVIASCVGAVDALTTDLALVEGNLGATSCVWNAETLLSPSLSLTPPRKTVVAGAEIVFTASENTNAVSWFMTDNRSGAALGAYGAQTARYSAGSTSDCVDVVEVWDGVNSFGRGYVNIISPAEVARCGKAVVLAGRASSADPLWPSTRYLANMGYNALRYRGYSRENIQYLSPVPGADVDGDGQDNDIAAPSTLANVASTFTNWVWNADKLFVYMVDHGGVSGDMGFFRLNANESLSAFELDGWLDAMQDQYTNDVVLVIDCCNSGSFLPWLTYSGVAKRVVLTACGANEPTVFVAGGLVSFSEAFFSGIMHGLSVGEAFAFAKSAMSSYQTSQMDDTKDGVSSGADGAIASATTVGSSFIAGKDVPQIGLVLGNQQLAGYTVATLWASDVVAGYPIARVWCLIVPPGHQPDPANPVMDLPQLDLTYNPTTGRYEAQYAGFSEEGTYKVVYYAKDIWESVSQPRQSYVVQSGFLERAIVVAGGTTNHTRWADVSYLADYAYEVFRQRRLATNAVCYLSQTMRPHVSGLSSRAGLFNAVTNWASGSNKLSLHMASPTSGTNGIVRLNMTETMTASELDGLLDAYQVSNATVTVVLDFDGAGSWVSALAAPNRVCVASTGAKQSAVFSNRGLVSFSCFFFDYVRNGEDLWSAFYKAGEKIKNATGKKQGALLDSNADGHYVSKTDQVVARQWYLGSAFMTGADVPTIEAVTPDTVLTGTNGATLWASGVADIGGVSNVFCLITTPSFVSGDDLVQLDLLWNPEADRYEVCYDGFTENGTYACTFFVTDSEGLLSIPIQTLLDVVDPDDYETDDAPSQAAVFEIGVPQEHNLHVSGDADWVKFFAPSGTVVVVKATQLGDNCDLRLDVYRETVSGELIPVAESDNDHIDLDTGLVYEEVDLDLCDAENYPAGFYYARAKTSDYQDLWGPGSEYRLEVYVAIGAGESLIVVAVDKLNPACSPSGAVAVWDGTNSLAFGNANSMLLSLSEGVHTVQVTTAAGYLPEVDPFFTGQVDNLESYWYGNPKKAVSVSGSPRMAVFQFVPVTKAEGRVLDRLTGAPVAGAGLSFVASSGPLNGLSYNGYPNSATYKSSWLTAQDGSFPTNVWLPTAGWDLTVSSGSYTNLVRAPAVASMPAGTVTNLGTLLLTPVDLNGNGVADGWETQYGLANVTAASDADNDQFPDRSEYLAGTDPTNRFSVFQILEMIESPAADCGLRWNAGGGRSYRVFWTDTPGSWPSGQNAVVGPTNAWRDPAEPKPASRFYRVGVELPQCP